MSDYITVGAINRYLKHVLDNDPHLQDVFLKGEISNFKAHGTGHLYFSLKDETGRINAIMFKFNAAKLNFKPEDGMKVLVHGKISVYEATGNYQIYIDDMQEDGLGNLYLAFEELKKKLSAAGLFDEEHKQIIPAIPKRVGVITAPTGAAVKDIITTIKRRWPLAEIILFPSLVQGDGAKESLVNRINQAQEHNIDVIILGRGGGSIEDLWAFNEETVARAIFDSKVPIISAVGHETDFTIADLVADLRAPTPTAAAEMAVPSKEDVIRNINTNKIRINESINKIIKLNQLHFDRLRNSFILKNINALYEPKIEKLMLLTERLNRLIEDKVKLFNLRVTQLIEKLLILNPLQTLTRGYAIVKSNTGVITSVKQVSVGDNINIELTDGVIESNIINKEVKND